MATRYALHDNSPALQPDTIYAISYRTRDLGHGYREEGIVKAFWTGDIDAWGKLTIVRVTGIAPLYLFQDEIKAVR